MHIDNNQSANTWSLKCNSRTLEEQAIINVIKSNLMVKQEEIASETNKFLRTVKTYMSVMQEKGLIERINEKRNGKWIAKLKENI